MRYETKAICATGDVISSRRIMIENMNWIVIAILIGGYFVLLSTSGIVVNYILSKISEEPISQKISKEVRDTGFVVGKCENLLILTFMLLDAYTALALIFAAKAIYSP